MAANKGASSMNSDGMQLGNTTHRDHQDNFDPVRYCVIIGVIMAIGVIGNSLNAVIYSSKNNRKDSLSVYFRAIAVSDSLVLVLTFTDDTVSRIYGADILYGNKSLCPWVLFVNQFWPVLSSTLLVAIAVDRFIAVAYPHMRASLCTYKRAVWTVMGIVTLCACLSLPEVIWNEIVTNKYAMVEEANYECPVVKVSDYYLMVVVCSFLLILAIPFTIVMILNLRVYCLLKASQYVRIQQGQGPSTLAMTTLPVVGVTICSVCLLLPVLLVESAEFVVRWVDVSPWLQNGIDTAWDTTNVIRLLHYTMNFYFFMIFSKAHRKTLRQAFRRSLADHENSVSENQELNIGMGEVTNYNTEDI